VNHGTVPVPFPSAFPFASRGTGRPPDVTGCAIPGRAVNHGTVTVPFPFASRGTRKTSDVAGCAIPGAL